MNDRDTQNKRQKKKLDTHGYMPASEERLRYSIDDNKSFNACWA